jgi:hypothetical protein
VQDETGALKHLIAWFSASAAKSRQIDVGDIPSNIDLGVLEVSEKGDNLHRAMKLIKSPRQRSFRFDR